MKALAIFLLSSLFFGQLNLLQMNQRELFLAKQQQYQEDTALYEETLAQYQELYALYQELPAEDPDRPSLKAALLKTKEGLKAFKPQLKMDKANLEQLFLALKEEDIPKTDFLLEFTLNARKVALKARKLQGNIQKDEWRETLHLDELYIKFKEGKKLKVCRLIAADIKALVELADNKPPSLFLEELAQIFERYDAVEKIKKYRAKSRFIESTIAPYVLSPNQLEPILDQALAKDDFLTEEELKEKEKELEEKEKEKLAKEEQQAKEEEELLRKKEEQYHRLFERRLAEESNKLDLASSQGDTSIDLEVIDIKRLKANEQLITAYGPAEELKKLILIHFYNQLKAENKLVTISEVKPMLKESFHTYASKNMVNELYRQANQLDDQRLFSIFPSGFAPWLHESALKVNITEFASRLTHWQKDIIAAVDELRYDLGPQNKHFILSTALLKTNLALEFEGSFGPKSTTPNADILKQIIPNFEILEKMNLEKADDQWSLALAPYINSRSLEVEALYVDHILANIEQIEDTSNLLLEFEQLLPSKDSIKVAFLNSRYWALSKQPKTAIPLGATYSLVNSEDPLQKLELEFQFPISFAVKKNEAGQAFFIGFPTPNSRATVNTVSAMSYEADKTAQLVEFLAPRVVDIGVGALAVKGSGCFKLGIRDTSGLTVIQEAKNGAYQFIEMTTKGLQEEVLEKLGLSMQDIAGFQVKLVGDEYGNLGSLETRITVLGLPFLIGVSKDGLIGRFESQMDYQEKILQKNYNASRFDIFLSFDYTSYIEFDNGNNVIQIQNLRVGTLTGRDAGQFKLQKSKECQRYIKDIPKL